MTKEEINKIKECVAKKYSRFEKSELIIEHDGNIITVRKNADESPLILSRNILDQNNSRPI